MFTLTGVYTCYGYNICEVQWYLKQQYEVPIIKTNASNSWQITNIYT